jgi:holo-[acyl-carrier protein] synthase
MAMTSPWHRRRVPVAARRAAAGATAAGIRVGIDLVRVEDVRRSLATFGEAYLRRLFTADEIAYARAPGASADVTAERLAARFAAKEAARKVLGLDEAGVGFRSIEVVRSPSGACSLSLHREAREAARRARLSELSLSMSHEGEVATAVVIARREEPRSARARPRRPGAPDRRRVVIRTEGRT